MQKLFYFLDLIDQNEKNNRISIKTVFVNVFYINNINLYIQEKIKFKN